jgi:hypothetical protein
LVKENYEFHQDRAVFLIIITGTQWVEVNPPLSSPNNEICQLLQVSAGINGVWALTKDEQVILVLLDLLKALLLRFQFCVKMLA